MGMRKGGNNGFSCPSQKINFSECRVEARNLGLFFFNKFSRGLDGWSI